MTSALTVILAAKWIDTTYTEKTQMYIHEWQLSYIRHIHRFPLQPRELPYSSHQLWKPKRESENSWYPDTACVHAVCVCMCAHTSPEFCPKPLRLIKHFSSGNPSLERLLGGQHLCLNITWKAEPPAFNIYPNWSQQLTGAGEWRSTKEWMVEIPWLWRIEYKDPNTLTDQ